MKKYVITGGPGIGKSTLIEIFAGLKYTTVPEAARTIIEEEKMKDSEILPWKNLERFQERVAEEQIRQESLIEDKIAFLDRGIIDGYAYCKIGNITPPKIIEDESRNRYEKVFVLEPLNTYELDGIRHENQTDAMKVHNSIIDSYINFGYEPILVPVLTPKERAIFILSKIN